MSITWSELSKNSDQNEAFLHISAFLKSIDYDVFSYAELSQVMLAGAFTVMDYEDTSDTLLNFNYDEGRARQIRLSNFTDYVLEYTQRRLGLVSVAADRYMLAKAHQFKMIASSGEVEISGLEFEDLLIAGDDLSALLLAKGNRRLSLAKAYIDAAFVAALQAGEGYYKEFSRQVMQSLDPQSETLQWHFAQEKEKIEAVKVFANAGSTTIH